MSKTRVLIIDDSALFRQVLGKTLSAEPSIEVVGEAADVYEGRDKIVALRPDVLTLDVEMPKMNGIDFLKKLLPQYPIPVIVITSSAVTAFDAVSAGAVDFSKKPAMKEYETFSAEITKKILAAKSARVTVPKPQTARANPSPLDSHKLGSSIIALGASTGGTDALQTVLQDLPENTPGVVVVQHMPAGFTKMYADRLNRQCRMKVVEATDGERLEAGKIIIGAGEFHLRLEKDANGYYVSSKRGEKVSGHCPSVNVMFESVAETAGDNAIGVILTGMGNDGAEGLLKMKKAGAFTIGQDKETCVVYGMPMVAYNIGAVDKQAPLGEIASVILDKLK